MFVKVRDPEFKYIFEQSVTPETTETKKNLKDNSFLERLSSG